MRSNRGTERFVEWDADALVRLVGLVGLLGTVRVVVAWAAQPPTSARVSRAAASAFTCR